MKEFKPFRAEFEALKEAVTHGGSAQERKSLNKTGTQNKGTKNSPAPLSEKQDWLIEWEKQQEEKAEHLSELLKKSRENMSKE